MSYDLDLQTGEHLWCCPQCGETIRFPNLLALRLAERAGACQGCRARATFERNPGLVALFLDFWMRNDAWPQSNSWMEAVSRPVAIFLLHAGVERKEELDGEIPRGSQAVH